MEKLKELKEKIGQNTKKIKETKVINILLSASLILSSIAIPYALKDIIALLIGPALQALAPIGFITIGLAATAMSNSWAIEKIINLKNENNQLNYELERNELMQKIEKYECRALNKSEINYIVPLKLETKNISENSSELKSNELTK